MAETTTPSGVTRELLPIWAGPTTRLVGGDEVGSAGAGAVYHVADPPPEESVGQVAAGAEEATTTTAITPSSTITTAPGGEGEPTTLGETQRATRWKNPGIATGMPPATGTHLATGTHPVTGMPHATGTAPATEMPPATGTAPATEMHPAKETARTTIGMHPVIVAQAADLAIATVAAKATASLLQPNTRATRHYCIR